MENEKTYRTNSISTTYGTATSSTTFFSSNSKNMTRSDFQKSTSIYLPNNNAKTYRKFFGFKFLDFGFVFYLKLYVYPRIRN